LFLPSILEASLASMTYRPVLVSVRASSIIIRELGAEEILANTPVRVAVSDVDLLLVLVLNVSKTFELFWVNGACGLIKEELRLSPA